MTPYEKLKSLPEADQYHKPGTTFKQLAILGIFHACHADLVADRCLVLRAEQVIRGHPHVVRDTVGREAGASAATASSGDARTPETARVMRFLFMKVFQLIG